MAVAVLLETWPGGRHAGLLVFRNRSDTVFLMNKTVIEVQVRAVLPTSGGCAVFLGNNDKVFIIYVDQSVGSAITMFMRGTVKERPLTHDLMGHLMTGLGAHVERVIINDLKNATYYARMIIRAENELQQKKIIELDGRPSDCIAMAVQQKVANLRQPGSVGGSRRHERCPAQDGRGRDQAGDGIRLGRRRRGGIATREARDNFVPPSRCNGPG